MSWIAKEAAADQLLQQAGADLKRLGHTTTEWLQKDGRYYSRCLKCADGAVVSPRSFHDAPIRGPASIFRCRGSK